MITRIWHGRTAPENTEYYLNFLLDKGTQEYLETEGNLSVKVWSKKEHDCTHYWTVTEWPGIESIRKFAGEDYDKAKYYPEDEGILLEFEDKVEHYESFDVSNKRIGYYLRQLDQLYQGGSWQSESISAKLKSISESEAFQQPMPNIHCVAEIVWHCIYWRKVFLNRMNGNHLYRDQTMEELNFLPLAELEKKGWQHLVNELAQTQSELTHQLSTKRDTFLDEEYAPGYTFDHHLEGLVQHDLYHLGQIGLVIKIIRTPKPKEPLTRL